MKLPVYNCIIDENPDEETGIYAISFVGDPANETDFIALAAEEVRLKKDCQKQILTGVILKPGQLIYRYSPQAGEYYIRFTANEIEKIARKMMKTGVALYNTTHQHEIALQGNFLTELWIVEDPHKDKSAALGFTGITKGSLMCSYKIESSEYWKNEILTGNVKGFSLEGLFGQEVSLSELTNKLRMKKKKFKFTSLQRAVMLASGISKQMLAEIESVEQNDSTGSGETFREFTLSDGKTVKVDDEGFATFDGEQMPAGEHILSDGNIMLIDENGNFSGTREPSAGNTTEEQIIPEQSLSKTKMETDTTAVQVLRTRIAELEAIISDLTARAEEAEAKAGEAKNQVEEMKKKTPSISPAIPGTNQKKITEMPVYERIAYTANLRIHK